MSQIISIIIGIVLFLHGLIHLMGFATYWQLAEINELPYKTTLVNGRFDIGDTGIRVYGLAWLLLAVAFLITAYGLIAGQPWARGAILVTATISLVVTALDSQVAYAGMIVNIVLLLVFALTPFFLGG